MTQANSDLRQTVKESPKLPAFPDEVGSDTSTTPGGLSNELKEQILELIDKRFFELIESDGVIEQIARLG